MEKGVEKICNVKLSFLHDKWYNCVKMAENISKNVLFIVFAAIGGGKNTYFLEFCGACKMVEKYYGCKSRDKLPVLQPESWDNPGKCPPGAKQGI